MTDEAITREWVRDTTTIPGVPLNILTVTADGITRAVTHPMTDDALRDYGRLLLELDADTPTEPQQQP